MPGSGVPNALRVCAVTAAVTRPAAAMLMMKCVFLNMSLLRNQRTAHEGMTGSAEFRAFEDVFSRLWRDERHRGDAFAPLGNNHVDVGAHDAESVIGVVATQTDFDRRAGLHAKFRRREA